MFMFLYVIPSTINVRRNVCLIIHNHFYFVCIEVVLMVAYIVVLDMLLFD